MAEVCLSANGPAHATPDAWVLCGFWAGMAKTQHALPLASPVFLLSTTPSVPAGAWRRGGVITDDCCARREAAAQRKILARITEDCRAGHGDLPRHGAVTALSSLSRDRVLLPG